MFDQLLYKPFGERAILIEWGATISKEILCDIVQFKEQVVEEKKLHIADVVVGYHSLTIIYKHNIENFTQEINQLQKIYFNKKVSVQKKPNHWKIPVCYDIYFGIDLEALATEKNVSIETIIHLHTSTIYTVYFIGFLPGFLYLGGLDATLHTPRKATPRLQVAKGAVAIGGSQTGIYPQESAGGWNIIGNSPISFFEVEKPTPCFASSGDTLEFIAIDITTYQQLEKEISHNCFNFKNWQKNG